jgi:exosortase A-associated hydrolase 1
MVERAISFRCGEETLVGVLHEAASAAITSGVLIVVGGPQYRIGSHRQFVLMARSLARRGCPVFRFDYRGMGDSDGEPRAFDDVNRDIAAAVDAFFAAQPDMSGVVLWGLCDGASASLIFSGTDRRVRGIVLVNPWVRTDASEARVFLQHYYLQRLLQRSFWRKLLSGGFNPVKSAGELATSVATASRSSGDPQAAARTSFIGRMLAGFSAFSAPVLVLISERDLTAQEFTDLCARDRKWRAAMARRHVNVVKIDGADHTFSTRAALESATQQCASWLTRLTQRA